MTLGETIYVLPHQTLIYKAGDFFVESGDINHVVHDTTDKPKQHLLSAPAVRDPASGSRGAVPDAGQEAVAS